MRPFRPDPGKTVNLTAGTTSSRVQFADNPGDRDIRVHNAGSVTVFIRQGDSNVAATTTVDIPIPAGSAETFKATGNTYLAAITASSTAVLYVTPGEGI